MGLEERGLKAYITLPDLSKRTEYYPASQFEFGTEKDQYIFSRRNLVSIFQTQKRREFRISRKSGALHNAYPVKTACTGSKSGRHIFRSFHQEFIDRVSAYTETREYQKAMRKRGVWVEPLFGEAKEFHRLRRFRLRGLQKTNIEGVMITA